MKTKTITLRQIDSHTEIYCVDTLVNTLKPRVGSMMKPAEVNELITRRDTKVTINRAKT